MSFSTGFTSSFDAGAQSGIQSSILHSSFEEGEGAASDLVQRTGTVAQPAAAEAGAVVAGSRALKTLDAMSSQPSVSQAAALSQARNMHERTMVDTTFWRQQLSSHMREDENARLQMRTLFFQRLQELNALYVKIDRAVDKIIKKCVKIDKENMGCFKDAARARRSGAAQEVIDQKDDNLKSQLDLAKLVKTSLHDTFVLAYSAIEKAHVTKSADSKKNFEILLEGRIKDIENLQNQVEVMKGYRAEDCKILISLHDQALKEEAQRVQLCLEAERTLSAIEIAQRKQALEEAIAAKEAELKMAQQKLEEMKVDYAHQEATLREGNAHTQKMTALQNERDQAIRNQELEIARINAEKEIKHHQLDVENRHNELEHKGGGICSIM